MSLCKRFSIWMVGLYAALIVPGAMGIMAAEDATPAAMEETAVPAEEANYDTPLVRYGDFEMSLGYFFFYARVSNDKLRMVNRMEGEDREALLNNAMKDILFEHLMARDAENSGFKNDSEYTTHVRDMENDWLTRLYEYHHFFKDYKPSEEQLQKLYDEKKSEYFQQEQFSFRHIFLRTIDLPEAEQKKARERAEAALALIKAGSDFVEVAKEYSDSDRKGNVIGPMTPSKYNPEKPLNSVLEEALLAMKPGDISEIIQTKYGYEILKLESLRPESYQTLEDVRDQLSTTLRAQDYGNWKKELLASHWDKAVTKWNPDVMFKEDAAPDEVLFEAYGQAFTTVDYNWLKGREFEKKADESEEQFRERRIDFLKNTLAYRYVIGKTARDLHYDRIPFFIERTTALRNFRTYLAWWNRQQEKYIQEHPVTEEDKKAYYEDNQSRFLQNQTAHVGEMTFRLPAHNKEVLYEVHKAQQAAEAKAKEAIKRVKGGEEFAKVAREMSESETAKNGGDLGVISVDTSSIPRAVATQAIRLATGEVCEEPIQSEETYYVVICYDKPLREPIPFDEPGVQESVHNGVLGKKRQELREQLIAKLYDESKVELLYKGLYKFNPAMLSTQSLDPPGEEEAEEK